jgi:hypothetical protein
MPHRAHRTHRSERGLLAEHSLSLIVGGILLTWFVLYLRANPSTHIGAFYGNAIADWTGTLLIVLVTKYFFEQGSKESRRPPKERSGVRRLLVSHSLTIFLVATGAAWAVVYARSDANSKSGQVIGNIVSEWTQVLGLVLITKYARERGSKESA